MQRLYGMVRWQGRLERKQAFLERAVDIGAELFALTATCSRARILAAGGASAFALADVFCRGARRRTAALFADLWRNDDAFNYAAAQGPRRRPRLGRGGHPRPLPAPQRRPIGYRVAADRGRQPN